jgi:hypothetical protein
MYEVVHTIGLMNALAQFSLGWVTLRAVMDGKPAIDILMEQYINVLVNDDNPSDPNVKD